MKKTPRRLSVPIIFAVHLMSFSSHLAHNTVVKRNEIARAWIFFSAKKMYSFVDIHMSAECVLWYCDSECVALVICVAKIFN